MSSYYPQLQVVYVIVHKRHDYAGDLHFKPLATFSLENANNLALEKFSRELPNFGYAWKDVDTAYDENGWVYTVSIAGEERVLGHRNEEKCLHLVCWGREDVTERLNVWVEMHILQPYVFPIRAY